MASPRSLTPLILAAAILTPGLVAGQPVAVSRLLEIAPPVSEPGVYRYRQPAAVSLGPAGFAVAWAKDAYGSYYRFFSSVSGVRLDGRGRALGRFQATSTDADIEHLWFPTLARQGADAYLLAYVESGWVRRIAFRRFRNDTREIDTESTYASTTNY